jgi:hypothetical protein
LGRQFQNYGFYAIAELITAFSLGSTCFAAFDDPGFARET